MSTTVVQSRMPRIGNTFINEATYQVARRALQRSHSWSFSSNCDESRSTRCRYWEGGVRLHVNDMTALCLPTTDTPGVVATIEIFASPCQL